MLNLKTNQMFIISIVGNPPAAKDCWFIGDKFLEQTFSTFTDIRNEGNAGKINKTYTFDYYNVDYFAEHPLSTSRNTISNIRNAVVKALNKYKNKLPRLLVILPEDDILKFINHFSYGVSRITGRYLNWLITEIDKLVSGRREELRKRKAGSVGGSEPKIIWGRMMDRPNISYNDMLAVRIKYNSILEDILANKRNHYILDVSKEVVHPLNFMYNNQINASGRNDFWLAIDRQLELFDYDKTPFVPVPSQPPYAQEQRASHNCMEKPIAVTQPLRAVRPEQHQNVRQDTCQRKFNSYSFHRK